MSQKSIATGFLNRSSRLVGMAAKVASQELRHGWRRRLADTAEQVGASELRARVEQARVLAQGLGELKGAAMKVGQLLSIDSGDLIPEQASEILSRLQGKAEPVGFDVMKRVLEEDLGPTYRDRFDRLEGQAAAAASIGQVHRGWVDGSPVAVKIQYPGVAASIDSDMKLLATIADGWLTMTRSRIDVDETLEEMRTLLHLEADYERELRFLQAYGAALTGDRRFVVPSAVSELCGPRVLTMTWQDGMTLRQWLATAPSPVERQQFATAMLDLFCDEFVDWGMVQTDPNHGNFLVDDEGRIVLLDFGATLRYDPAFRAEYARLLRTVATKDVAATVQAGIDFGVFDPREPAETGKLFAEMLFTSIAPFEAPMQPFVFRNEAYAAQARDIGRRFTASLKYSPPPRKLLFLHRKLGGIFQLLRKVDVAVDLSPYWHRMIAGGPTPQRRLEPSSARRPSDAALSQAALVF